VSARKKQKVNFEARIAAKAAIALYFPQVIAMRIGELPVSGLAKQPHQGIVQRCSSSAGDVSCE
jgi:hypothetical protein